MVATYTIFGRQVGSHWLSIAVLGSTFVLGSAAMGGKKKEQIEKGPPINAGSKGEEDFITEFLRQNEGSQAAGIKQ